MAKIKIDSKKLKKVLYQIGKYIFLTIVIGSMLFGIISPIMYFFTN